MSVYQLHPQPTAAVHWLERLHHWAQVQPLQVALRHKRHGQWQAWRWIDVQREVEQRVDGLRQQGFDARSCLLVCGAFEPDLLLLGLAAHALGGRVSCLPEGQGATELVEQWRRLRPSHAFVQKRRDLQQWLAAAASYPGHPCLIVAQAPLGEVATPALQVLAQWRAAPSQSQQLRPWRGALATHWWAEEGSEWGDGLHVLWQQWLDSGQPLGFPESLASAARDRRDVRPVALLLSAPRLAALAAEIEQRLPPARSWRRALCDWAIAQPGAGVRRRLKQRVRRLLGLDNLRSIWQAPQAPVVPAHAWVRDVHRDAA